MIAGHFCLKVLFHDSFTIFRRRFISIIYRKSLFRSPSFTNCSRLRIFIGRLLGHCCHPGTVLHPASRPFSFCSLLFSLPTQNGRRQCACHSILHSLLRKIDFVSFRLSFAAISFYLLCLFSPGFSPSSFPVSAAFSPTSTPQVTKLSVWPVP